MKRAELEGKGLSKEQVDFVMAEYGKDIKAEQDKAKKAVEDAEKPLNEKIAGLEKAAKEQAEARDAQVAELNEKIKSAAGIDEKAKAELAEMQKNYDAKVKEIEAASAAKAKEIEDANAAALAKLELETGTREFIAGMGKKFITPETEAAFAAKINERLMDKKNIGKSRTDILAELAKGEDGKERTDIFESESTQKPQGATGGSGTQPPDTGGPATLSGALAEKYKK